MAWFKVDDKLPTHPKALAAGLKSMGLWAMCGAWAMSQETDGFIPRSAVTMLGGTRNDAARLVTAGLWDVAEDGWRFHDWAEYQPTASSLRAKRDANKERMSRARSHSVRVHNANSAPNPIPIPIPLDITPVNKSIHVVDVRANGIDSDLAQSALEIGVTNVADVQDWFAGPLGFELSPAQAVELARYVLLRAVGEVRNPMGYLRRTAEGDAVSLRALAVEIDLRGMAA